MPPKTTAPVAPDPAPPTALVPVDLPDDILGELEGAAPEIDKAARVIPHLTWNLRPTTDDAAGEPCRHDRLYWTDENMPAESADIVILDTVGLGARWSQMVGDDRKKWCHSFDRITGGRSPDAPELPGQDVDCAKCGKMAWGKRRGGPKPVCSIYEDLAVFEPSSGKIGVARFTVTGLSGINGTGGLRTFQRRHVMGQWQHGGVRRDRPYVMMLVKLTPVRAKDLGDARDYSVPVLDLVRFHTADEIRELLALRKGVLEGVRAGTIVHEEDAEPEPATAAPGGSPAPADETNPLVDDGTNPDDLPFI